MDSSPSRSDSPGRASGTSRLTLVLIFSPLLAMVLVGILIVAGVIASLALADTSIELKRGNLLHEWLLEAPLSEFPSDLIKGTHRYFWGNPELGPTSDNVLTLDTPIFDPRDFDLATGWLKNQGFTVTESSRSDAELVDSTGRRAWISHSREGSGGFLVIRVDCYPP